MEDVANSSSPNAGGPCTCNICLLHPHLKEALRRMQPPELRLYSRTELLELLEKDIANACDEQQKQVVSFTPLKLTVHLRYLCRQDVQVRVWRSSIRKSKSSSSTVFYSAWL